MPNTKKCNEPMHFDHERFCRRTEVTIRTHQGKHNKKHLKEKQKRVIFTLEKEWWWKIYHVCMMRSVSLSEKKKIYLKTAFHLMFGNGFWWVCVCVCVAASAPSHRRQLVHVIYIFKQFNAFRFCSVNEWVCREARSYEEIIVTSVFSTIDIQAKSTTEFVPFFVSSLKIYHLKKKKTQRNGENAEKVFQKPSQPEPEPMPMQTTQIVLGQYPKWSWLWRNGRE